MRLAPGALVPSTAIPGSVVRWSRSTRPKAAGLLAPYRKDQAGELHRSRCEASRREPPSDYNMTVIPRSVVRWSRSPRPKVAALLAVYGKDQAGELHRSRFGVSRREPQSDYEMSLGKIRCVLQEDYTSFFEREPSFEIYHDRIVFELGRPFHSLSAVTGKPAYRRALVALRCLGTRALSNGVVKCRVFDGRPFGHDLKVSWSCEGFIETFNQPVHVSAISLYKIAKQDPLCTFSLLASQQQDLREPREAWLSHRIQRHCIEFTAIHPPSIRSLLQKLWWQPQMGLDPSLAFLNCKEFCDVSAAQWGG